MDFMQEQKKVKLGILSAVIFSLVFVIVIYTFLPWHMISAITIDHLVFSIQCDFFALFALLFGIKLIATQRFFDPTAISGQNIDSNKKIIINIRYLLNTLEQFILLFVSHLTLSTLLTNEQIKIIPILVVLFLIGRITFWIGYHKSPTSRAFGFATTFYPTVFVMAFCFLKLISQL